MTNETLWVIISGIDNSGWKYLVYLGVCRVSKWDIDILGVEVRNEKIESWKKAPWICFVKFSNFQG